MSSSFHGRDVFAYAAGLIAAGRRPEEVGPRVPKIESLDLPPPKLAGKTCNCHVLHIDAFGNIITDVSEEMIRNIPAKFGGMVYIRLGTRKLQAQYARSYYEVDDGAMAVLLGSQGFLELAVREGSARDRLDLKTLDKLELEF